MFIAAIMTALSLQVYAQIRTPEQEFIPGRYEYTHSWSYTAPGGNGIIHCGEVGVLYFYADGTFADTAYQYHQLGMARQESVTFEWISPEPQTTDAYGFYFHYFCPGEWRVENGKFLFSENSISTISVQENGGWRMESSYSAKRPKDSAWTCLMSLKTNG